MREDDHKKTPPTDYWTVLPSSTDWALNIIDPDGRHGAYIKGDGCVHVWEYANQKEDMSCPEPTRTWYGNGKDDFHDEEAEYRMIDLDNEILRLLTLRETAIRYFEEHGCQTAREEFYYGKTLGTITMGKHIPIELDIMPQHKVVEGEQ